MSGCTQLTSGSSEADAQQWRQRIQHPVQNRQRQRRLHLGAGVDSIVSDPTLPDLPLSRIVDPALASSMVNYLAGIVLHYQLRLDLFKQQQQQQLWKPKSPRLIRHICVLGLGELGQAAVQYFLQQGYLVSGWSRSLKLRDQPLTR